ncbi:ATP synthase subunit a (mitochondrion) [Yarrowia sp. C11]|nr:ATP synthase subunit a [Yarrowia sp. E02]KAG5354313.1 ATP synthase subunit a [Yarrowia sp. C11]
MNFIINSPLEQFTTRVYFGLSSGLINLDTITLTSFSIYSIAVVALILGFSILNDNNTNILPTRWSLAFESLYFTVEKMVSEQIGGLEGRLLFPFMFSLFMYILIANVVSLVPYSYAINAQLIWTIGLSVAIWFGCTLTGLANHGAKFFGLFLPSGTNLPLVPVLVIIELLSYMARALSLGLRLGSNILAGHLLLVILAGLILNFISISIFTFALGILPLSILLGIVALESAIAFIQAIVFTILTCSYIKDAIHLH